MMTQHSEPVMQQHLLTQFENSFKHQHGVDGLGQFMAFCRLYFSASPIDELTALPFDVVFGATYSIWLWTSQRDDQAVKVRVLNPDFEQHGWQSPHTLIELVLPDAPFIVDTLRLEVANLGFGLQSMTHAVIDVQRDAQGQLLEVFEQASNQPQAHSEAVIQIALSRQSNAKRLDQLKAVILHQVARIQAMVVDFPSMVKATRDILLPCEDTVEGLCSEDAQETHEFVAWLENQHFCSWQLNITPTRI